MHLSIGLVCVFSLEVLKTTKADTERFDVAMPDNILGDASKLVKRALLTYVAGSLCHTFNAEKDKVKIRDAVISYMKVLDDDQILRTELPKGLQLRVDKALRLA